MELMEAIIHARSVAEGCPGGDRDCAYQHDHLVDWLEELKAYKDAGITPEDVKLLAERKSKPACEFCKTATSAMPRAQSTRTGKLMRNEKKNTVQGEIGRQG